MGAKASCRFFLDMVVLDSKPSGAEQVTTVRVVDPKFPAAQGVGLLDPNSMTSGRLLHSCRISTSFSCRNPRESKAPCNSGDHYPITWCSTHGQGRVFNTGLGHRDDVWTNELYQHVAEGILWAAKKIDGRCYS